MSITIRPTGASDWISAPVRLVTWAATSSIRFSVLWVWLSRSPFVLKARRRMNGTGRSTAKFFTSSPERAGRRPISCLSPGMMAPPNRRRKSSPCSKATRVPEAGSIFIGTEGVMLLPNYLRPTLYPREKFKDYRYPDVGRSEPLRPVCQCLPGRGSNHHRLCLLRSTHGNYSAGRHRFAVSQDHPEWNAKKMKFNLPEANHFLRRKYRQGWSVKGLS